MVALILLGAGASYGSGETYFGTSGPRRVPLGDKLFSDLEALGGEADRMPAHIKLAFKRSGFEAGMQQFYDHIGRAEISHNPGSMARFLAETGKYLATFKIGEKNAYIDLLRSLAAFEVIYASLNYDILLEQAATHLGMPFKYGLNPPPGALRILKPHGSSNFWHRTGFLFSDVEHRLIGTGPISEIPPSFTMPTVPLHDYSENLTRYAVEDSIPPSMALYARGKRFLVGSDFMRGQQQGWTVAAGAASVIFVTGVAVFPEDQHIWEPLATSQAGLVYFGMPNDKDQFDSWASIVGRRNAHFEQATFEECIPSIRKTLLMHSIRR